MSGPLATDCARCGDSIGRHERGGGECRAADADGRCPCPGFLHVEVARRALALARARREAELLWRR